MEYDEAVAYLLSRERLGIKFGLENIEGLAADLGHPERTYQSILIAGTNGKGSTAAFLESILRTAGLRTGRYTSPHLVRLEERMMVEGEIISSGELASVVTTVRDSVLRLRRKEALLTEPTFFEITTACAFVFFRERNVQVGVFEVGMGGRWDATNVVPAGMAVLTPIGMDHERYLGNDLCSIAGEKAAIIRPERPVVVGFIAPEAIEIVRAEAERKNAPLFEVAKEVRFDVRHAEGTQHLYLETPEARYEDLTLPLAGRHQAENAAVAVRAVEVAARMGLEVAPEAVVSGVGSTHWEARLERIPGCPALLIDSAHNLMGAEALASYLAEVPSRPRVLLFALMDDKNVSHVLKPLQPFFRHVVATRPPNRRSMEPETIVHSATSLGLVAEMVEPTVRALAKARSLAGFDGEVVIAGSTFLAGEVKRLLELENAQPSGFKD
jgi:dihydrofolate synthase/folylpolyglutamate synthase